MFSIVVGLIGGRFARHSASSGSIHGVEVKAFVVKYFFIVLWYFNAVEINQGASFFLIVPEKA